RLIFSAAKLLLAAGRGDALRQRRRDHCAITIRGESIVLRDQAPLHLGNVAFETGWTFPDLVQYLNEHVYFWPGTDQGPIPSGLRHFQRYRNEDAIVLCIRSEALFNVNPNVAPLFSRYNSGAPRCTGGKGSPRSARTFLAPSCFDGTPSKVVEVVYRE